MEPRPGVTPPAPQPGDEDKPVEDLSKSPKDGSNGLLQPFNVKDKDGVPISAYSVDSDTGGWTDIDLTIWNLLAQFFFGIAKWFVGFACWLIDWALNFGLAKILVKPADNIATSLRDQVINRLGLPGLFLLFAGLYAAWQILFKNRSKGFAEAGDVPGRRRHRHHGSALTGAGAAGHTRPALTGRFDDAAERRRPDREGKGPLVGGQCGRPVPEPGG